MTSYVTKNEITVYTEVKTDKGYESVAASNLELLEKQFPEITKYAAIKTKTEPRGYVVWAIEKPIIKNF